MQKQNRSRIDTGHQPKRQLGDIAVPQAWWDIAWQLLFAEFLVKTSTQSMMTNCLRKATRRQTEC
jgi:hypothetical protein